MRWLPFLLVVFLPACERAGRYPAASKSAEKPAPPQTEKPQPLPPHWSWMEAQPVQDVPIEFVASTSPDWAGLRGFWNHYQAPPRGPSTIHLGQSPLGAAAAIVLMTGGEKVRIKVPSGLPDPTPYIPASNPPTLGKWFLGQKLFFDRKLLSRAADTLGCASCHQPNQGYTQPLVGRVDTATLINVVYNRHQFWDGRVQMLEEVVTRSLDDERPVPGNLKPAEMPQAKHLWGGLVQKLDLDQGYRADFRRVFGIEKPTQDAIGKALATYMRTILSGDSLYDRAVATAKNQEPTAADFLPHLSEFAMKRLDFYGKYSKETLARDAAEGRKLFFGKAGCAKCHPAPLFFDQDFHNLGFGDSEYYPLIAGKEPGRFAHVPIGLKEMRHIGAYKTPTLRALPRTAPYFHNGGFNNLPAVVQYLDREMHFNDALAEPFRAQGQRVRSLGLTGDEKHQLSIFLLTLDGEPVSSLVATPP